MNTIIRSFLALTVLIVSVAPAFASGPGFSSGVNDGSQVPLDGGVSLLAAAGIGYGIKKYKENRKGKDIQA